MIWDKRFNADYPWRFLPGWQNKVPLTVIMSDVFFQAPVAYIPPPEILTFTHENCPGRCKRTGKCYAFSYFMHKAGKPVPCAKKACEWVERLNDAIKNKQGIARTPLTLTQTTTKIEVTTCPACGQPQWWRKNELNSKWICCRCHPPVAGLDIIKTPQAVASNCGLN